MSSDQQARLKEGVLVAWGICRDGRKVLLHMTLGNQESLEAWLEMLRDMVRRGLRVPTLITTDGAPGLIAAVEQVWPRSLRQRCLAHKKRNVLDKVPAAPVRRSRLPSTAFTMPIPARWPTC